MKKIIAIILCLMMIFALAACASSNTPAPNQGSSGTPSAAPSGDSGSAATDDRVIKIGLPVSLSGNYVGHGQDVQNGATLAVEEINAAGGVLGHQLELVMGDIENQEPSVVTTIINRMITRDGINALTGGMINPSMVEIELVEENGIPYVGSSYAQAQERMMKANPGEYSHVSNVMPSYAKYQTEFPNKVEEWIAAGKFEPINKKVAVIMSQNDYSLFCGEGMRDTFKSLGWEIVVEEVIPYERYTEYEPILSKIRQEVPSIILYTDHTAANAATFFTSFLQDPTPSLVFLQATPSYAEFKSIMLGTQDGVIWSYASSLVGDGAEAYIERYAQRWGSNPNPYGGLLYDCVYVLADAMAKSGDPFDKEAVSSVLSDPNYSFDGMIGKYQFDQDRLALSGDDNIPFCLFQEEGNGEEVKSRVVSPGFLVKDDGFRIPHWYAAGLEKYQ